MTYEESLRNSYAAVRERLMPYIAEPEPEPERCDRAVRVPLAYYTGRPIITAPVPAPVPAIEPIEPADDYRPKVKLRRRRVKPSPLVKPKEVRTAEAKRREVDRRRERTGWHDIVERRKLLSNPFGQPWQAIVNEVAVAHNLWASDIMGRSRIKAHVAARVEAVRRVAAEVVMPGTGEPPSLTVMGRWFNRDHTSILYYLGRLRDSRHSQRQIH